MTDEMTPTARIVRRSHIDTKAVTVTITQKDAEPAVFPLSQIPFAAKEYLMLRGLVAELMASDDMQVTYVGFVAGEFPKTTTPATPKLSKTREAIAAALAYAKARQVNPAARGAVLKSAADALLPEMTALVRGMAKDKVKQLDGRADVQEHYNRLFGAKPSETSLLDVAGLTEPAAAEMELAAD